MANYCILCIPKTEKERVEKHFFMLPENENDLAILFQSEKIICYYFAYKGKLDLTPHGVFKGYAVDYEQKKILYSGRNAFPSITSPLSGCYIHIKKEKNALVTSNDLFGQLPMLYFAENDIVAISDSLFILTEIRRALHLPNTLHTPSAKSRAWVHGLATQLLSCDTMVQNVHYCPIGSTLHIKVSGEQPQLHEEKVCAETLFSHEIQDYRESIREGAENIASFCEALAHMEDTPTLLSLSGGIDSRVILAACSHNTTKNSIYITTNKNNAVDYPIAQLLAKEENFSFKTPVINRITKKDNLTGWFVSNAGIYDNLVGSSGIPQKNICILGGLGAEVLKGQFAWRSLDKVKFKHIGYPQCMQDEVIPYLWRKNVQKGSLFSAGKHILQSIINKKPILERTVVKAIYEEMRRGLASIGIAPENSMATEWHYLSFRNALHGGRHTRNTLHGYSPFLQKKLAALSRSPINEYPTPKKNSPSIVSDLLIALSPNLAYLPFDSADKNMSQSYIAQRAKYLGKITNIQRFTIEGHAQDVYSGTPALFIKLAQKRGFIGDFTDENIQKWVKQGYDSLPHDLQQAFYTHKYLTKNHTAQELLSQNFLGGAAGKLMSFCILN